MQELTPNEKRVVEKALERYLGDVYSENGFRTRDVARDIVEKLELDEGRIVGI